ncbi:MAG: zf-HC2 domain-containing protein [Chloroflexota bacterium]
MSHQEWSDKIPFYIAQTLSPDEKRRFEAHLADCEICQAELAEWQPIAAAVWREGDEVAQSLPPLSQEVYNRLTYRDREPSSRFSANPPRPREDNLASVPERPRTEAIDLPTVRRFRVPATLVAGIVMVILFGSLIVYLNRPTIGTEPEIILSAAPTQDIIIDATGDSEGVFGSGQASETPETPTLSVATEEGDLGQMQPEATNTPSPQPTATHTEVPAPTATVDDKDANTRDTGANPNGCIGTNTRGNTVSVLDSNVDGSEITSLEAGDAAWVYLDTGGGWYQVFVDNGTYIGFVPSDDLTLSGNCNAARSGNPIQFIPSRPTPEPDSADESVIRTSVQLSDEPTVIVVEGTFADFHTLPDSSAEIVMVGARGDQFEVTGYTGTGDQRWIRITDERQEMWVLASDVTEYPADDAPTQVP